MTASSQLPKVRLPTRRPDAPRSMSGTLIQILRKEGPLGLYIGLSASLLRQLTYATVRFAAYEDVKQKSAQARTPAPSRHCLPLQFRRRARRQLR